MITLLRKELLEAWRSYRFLAVAAVLTFFGLLGPLSVKYMPDLLGALPNVPDGLADLMPPPNASLALAEYVENITLFGAILALLVPMGALAGEKASGTAALVLSKPVGRGAFLFAKFLAHSTTFAVGVLVAGLGAYYYTGLLFGWLNPARFIALNVLLLFDLIAYMSFTLFGGAFFRSQLAAAGMGFAFLVSLGVLGAVPGLGDYLPAALVRWGLGLAQGVVGQPAWPALATTLGLVLAAFGLGWWVLRRQEI
ncbi:MAG TPA: ABC transporter permease subunit [Anaerolineales bacterium]|nr:ABC transporter permease subunit [Anaerolineales bacterium]